MMKRITKWNRFIYQHAVVVAMLYSFAIFIMVCLVSSLAWESADDFLISMILSGSFGEYSPYVLVLGYPVSAGLCWLQMHLPQLNWLTVLELVSVWSSFSVFIWAFLKKRNKIGYIFAIVFPPLFETGFYTSLQYTRSACLFCFAGLFLIYRNCIQYKKKAGIVIGTIMVLLGAFTRFGCLFLAIPFVGIWIVRDFFRIYKTHTLGETLKKFLPFVGVMCVMTLFLMGGKAYNNYKYDNNPDVKKYVKLNSQRAAAYDYLVDDYKKYQKAFQKIGFSKNDYNMLRGSIIYDTYFEKSYSKIAKVNKKSVGIANQYADEHMWSRWWNKLSYYQQGKNAQDRNLFIPFVCMVVVGAVFLTKDNWFAFLCSVGGTLAVSFYFITLGRFPPWVQDSVFLVGSFCSLYSVGKRRNNEGTVTVRSRQRRKIQIAVCIIGFTCTMLFEVYVTDQSDINASTFDENIAAALTHMSSDKSKVYMVDNFANCPFPIMDVYSVVRGLEPGEWENILRVGNWFIGHPVLNNQLKECDLTSPVSDLTKDNVYLLTNTNLKKIDIYKTFFKEHYNVKIKADLQEVFGTYGIYKLSVKEKK